DPGADASRGKGVRRVRPDDRASRARGAAPRGGTLAGAFEGQLDLGERLRTGGHELVVLSRLPRRKRLSVESRTRLLYVRRQGGPTEGGSDDPRAIPAAPCGCGADRAFPGRGRARGAAGRRGRGRREGALRPVTGTRGTAQLLRRVHGDLGR